ncbi:MAG: KH domain-containing protein [Deltaproteobacteria bacterium]|nr:KH domain-containing protein [Deltaproteobacteria bacterium]
MATNGPWAELVGYLAKELVDDPEAVTVTETIGEGDPDRVRVEVRVDAKDIGKVVGRDGRTARALRQVVWAAGNKARKRVIVEILE